MLSAGVYPVIAGSGAFIADVMVSAFHHEQGHHRYRRRGLGTDIAREGLDTGHQVSPPGDAPRT